MAKIKRLGAVGFRPRLADTERCVWSPALATVVDERAGNLDGLPGAQYRRQVQGWLVELHAGFAAAFLSLAFCNAALRALPIFTKGLLAMFFLISSL